MILHLVKPPYPHGAGVLRYHKQKHVPHNDLTLCYYYGMENVNWQEAAKWSNARPDSFTFVWDVRYERTMKYHWRKFARGVRRPSRAYVTGYAKRIVKGRMEVVAAVTDPKFAYYLEPTQGMQFIVNQDIADEYELLFEHVRSKGIEVKVVIL